jgi:hypothetical protein
MAHHQLKMYIPGAGEPLMKTATATFTNMHAPLLAGELDSPDVSTPSEWLNEPRTGEPVLSPLYNITHIFDNPVKSYASSSGFDLAELQELGTFETERILFGYFSIPIRAVFDMPLQVGDYAADPKWGEIFMFTNQTDSSHNGLYMALPGTTGPEGTRVIRAFIRLSDGNREYFGADFVASENVPITITRGSDSMRLYGVANDALVLPAAQGGIPLLHSDAAWAATAFPEPLDGRFVAIPWMLETVDPLKQPHVFLSLRHQTDPTENGTYKYDLTTGNQTDEDGVAFRAFTRYPFGLPNPDGNPMERYFSFNVLANGVFLSGRVLVPGGPIQFSVGSLALMLEDPGMVAVENKPVVSLPIERDLTIYETQDTVGHEMADGKWLFAAVHPALTSLLFIVRAVEVDGVFTVESPATSSRWAHTTDNIDLTTLTETEFLGLRLASAASLVNGNTNQYLFLSNAELTITPGLFKNTGTMLCGREFNADSMAFTHTLFQQRIGSSDTALDELRLRGLSVELPDVFATHGISHSSSGVGREHGRTPHVNIHIEDGKKTTSVERHNIHYRALRIPHQISYKYVYTDTGEALAAEHGDVVGKCVLTSQFRGFVV